MPATRGKRRNHQRRRGERRVTRDGARPVQPEMPAARQQPKRRRRGWELPLWGNLGIGLILVISALLLFIFPARGSGNGQRLVFLALYLVAAVFYLGKALFQIRARRSGPTA